jgi:hypothetical protein
MDLADLQKVYRKQHGKEDEEWIDPKVIADPKPPLTHLLCFITSLRHLALRNVWDNDDHAHVSGYEISDPTMQHPIGIIYLNKSVIARYGKSLDFIVVGEQDDGEDSCGSVILMAVAWKNGYVERIELVPRAVKAADWYATKPGWRIINLA